MQTSSQSTRGLALGVPQAPHSVTGALIRGTRSLWRHAGSFRIALTRENGLRPAQFRRSHLPRSSGPALPRPMTALPRFTRRPDGKGGGTPQTPTPTNPISKI